jgi:hypothetical protein
MGLKDEYLVKDVFTNNIALLGAVTSIVAITVVFFVFAKGSFIKQAQEIATKAQTNASYQIGQVKDNVENNNLLWTLIDSTWKSPDKSKAFVKKLADAQKLPRCNGKDCKGTEDEARLVTDIAKDRIMVGWGSKKGSIKYSFKVLYDNKDKFVAINTDDLLGKIKEPEAEAEESGE